MDEEAVVGGGCAWLGHLIVYYCSDRLRAPSTVDERKCWQQRCNNSFRTFLERCLCPQLRRYVGARGEASLFRIWVDGWNVTVTD
jgi:hypothetical protein